MRHAPTQPPESVSRIGDGCRWSPACGAGVFPLNESNSVTGTRQDRRGPRQHLLTVRIDRQRKHRSSRQPTSHCSAAAPATPLRSADASRLSRHRRTTPRKKSRRTTAICRVAESPKRCQLRVLRLAPASPAGLSFVVVVIRDLLVVFFLHRDGAVTHRANKAWHCFPPC